MNTLLVREERPCDAVPIAELIMQTYRDAAYSNHREHLMVARLRGSTAYIPKLSLVATLDGRLAGHLMMTRIHIRSDAGSGAAVSLALAPLSVLPACQGRGLGSALVHAAHRRAQRAGFTSVIVVGISGYYERFGYGPLDDHPIRLPFDVAPENRMARALTPDGLSRVSGVVEYAPEWMEA